MSRDIQGNYGRRVKWSNTRYDSRRHTIASRYKPVVGVRHNGTARHLASTNFIASRSLRCADLSVAVVHGLNLKCPQITRAHLLQGNRHCRSQRTSTRTRRLKWNFSLNDTKVDLCVSSMGYSPCFAPLMRSKCAVANARQEIPDMVSS